ncbi:MAG: recombinase family protein [Rubrobacter sp.]|nr:recombinase family protein [Rubrobacter sp.]
MPSANGHGPKRAILYARVSTDEQARSGYSLAQQVEALREHAEREGYEVLEEVKDPGQSGASLERPGMDRVRDLVVAGGVHAVLAQDADRITRDPAHRAFLDEELQRHETALIALDDWGDNSHEGELLKYMKGWVSKGERLKTAERTRRGKLQKVKEGKVLAGRSPSFGFVYTADRENYEVCPENMAVVRRMFREIGAEGKSVNSVRMAFNREQVATPRGGKFWSPKKMRDIITDDVYRAHTYEEVAEHVSPGVAARLDAKKRYGIWWFNRRRYESRQVAVSVGGKREYRRKARVYERPRSEWIAVPTPDSGIPREWVDAARENTKDNLKPSKNADRAWELSGGFLRCAECGCALGTHTTTETRTKTPRKYFYYRCHTRGRHGTVKACAAKKHHPAHKVEVAVWELVSGLLKDPERLKEGLDEMVEAERAGMRGDPDEEARVWFEKLAGVERERRGYLRLAAKGRMSEDELDEELLELEELRRTAERELEMLRDRKETLEELENGRDALLDSYAAMIPEALEELIPEERREIYQMLRLEVEVAADGTMEARGVLNAELSPTKLGEGAEKVGESLCESEIARPSTTFFGYMGSGRRRRA